MRRVGGLILLGVFAFSCGPSISNAEYGTPIDQATSSTSEKGSLSSDEYAVYSFVLEHEKGILDDGFTILKVTTFGEVSPHSTLSQVIESLKGMDSAVVTQDLIADYRSKNETSSELEDRFTTSKPHKLMSVVGNENYKPKGVIVKFSRVAFDSTGNNALVYFEYNGGPKSGSGSFIVLSKTDGKWNEKKRFTVWAS
jgi:hypothetical protein